MSKGRKMTYEEMESKYLGLERSFSNCYDLMVKGDSEIKELRAEVAVLKKRNEALATSAIRQSESQDAETQKELQDLREKLDSQHGPGQSCVIVRLKEDIAKREATIAQLMSYIDKLSQRLANAKDSE